MAENSDFLKPSIPRFDGYYDHWAMLMENLLLSKEYWSLIETGVTVAPANATTDQQRIANESKLTDLKVKNYLFQSIDRSILETILNRETARDIWNAMRVKYQGSTKVKRAQLQALRREFEVLEMGESESVEEYFARTMIITNKMTSCGERVEQTTVVEKILRSMTAKFNHVVCSIELSSDVTTLSIDELQSSLIVHEQRMKGQQVKQEEQALKVTNGGRDRGGRNSNSSRGRGRGRQSKENAECFKCHKLGHYQSDCPNWGENANYAEFDDEEEMLLMAKTNDDAKSENWFLDSGCSYHMAGNKDWFYDFDENYRDSVKLGDDSRMNVMGKGNVKLSINGRVHILTDVYFIPGLKTNLLSIGQIQQKNTTIVFKNDICKVYHREKGLLFATYMSTNRMYVVKAEVIAPRCLQASKIVNSQLWHNRYCHLSIKGLNILVIKDMVKGLPALKELDENCVNCLVGKQHKDAIPKQATWRASLKLELVHSDICGPINPKSNGGNMYFITFTDDLTRKTWIYLLKEKSSSLEIFKQFKAMVEKESSCSIQCLRTDRGGEYVSNAFNEFCSNHGIKRQLTTAYTPQQNGVSERKNRTLMNMVRSMLAGKGVPKVFWPEALKWATHVMNRSPTLSVKDITPEEAWSGIKPSVHHFRIFGCIAFAHIPDSQRSKLDDKSVKCVHLGLSEESKAYKLYDPERKKIIISRDVVFEESKGWNWNKSSDKKEEHSSNNEILSDEEIDTTAPAIADDNTREVQIEEDMNTSSDESDEALVNLPPRARRPPQNLNDFVTCNEPEQIDELHNLAVYVPIEDPTTFNEAVKSNVWIEAMNQEIKSIEKNHTWQLTNLPEGANVIGVKWIYKTKYNEK
ncbi:copia-type polyprotein, partial [Trifolium pratense]